MEAAQGIYSGRVKKESNGDIEEDKQDFDLKIGNGRSYSDEVSEGKKRFSPKQDLIKEVPETTDQTERSSTEPNSVASSLRTKSQVNDQLESTKAEMGEVKEENLRLKMYLGKIMKDYQTLQTQFNNIVQQENPNNNNNKATTSLVSTAEETELVSLSLGTFSNLAPKTNIVSSSNKNGKETMVIDDDDDENVRGGLSLGLDYKYVNSSERATDQVGSAVSNPSAESSFEEKNNNNNNNNEEEAGETWPPSKVLNKTAKRSTDAIAEQDEVSQAQNPTKKARVCVRARCDTPTMNDGCQWRKYGQKIAKGNPCPRAYYRCTVAPSCPVRKQVQRCADDMSILITTYEGTHNHPLTVAATAMASTTSAAASMLLSGSSTSNSTTRPDALAGFNTFESSKWNTNNNNNKQFYFPNNTSTYSSFQASHPTITLDLTSSTQSQNPNSFNHHFLNKFSNNIKPSTSPINSFYPSSSLSFGSSDSNTNNNNIWGNFGATSSAQVQQYNLIKSQVAGTLSGLTRQNSAPPFLQNPNNNNNNISNYQSYIQQKISTNPSSTSSSSCGGGGASNNSSAIAAATKAITADPTFQSALAAALTSIIGGQANNNNNNILHGEAIQNLKWPISSGDQQQQQHQVLFPASTSAMTSNNVTGCASMFLNKSAITNPPATSATPMMFLSSNSLSFSASKSASASPDETS